MLAAIDGDRDVRDAEVVARFDGMGAHPTLRQLRPAGDIRENACLRVRLEERRHPVSVQMIRVLMGEQHRGEFGQGLESGGESSRIE